MIDPTKLRAAYEKAKADLIAQQTDDRHWEGELSSSALSTATAISTLAISTRDKAAGATAQWTADAERIEQGMGWLLPQQNADGGWGDTDKSHSNISTTMLAVAAIHLAGRADSLPQVLKRANSYIGRLGGIAGLRKRYGRDKTFAVPILTNYALAGLIDWSEVPALPFELACVPQRLYRWMRMPVVSYAIPALVAIGQARFVHRPPRLPWMRVLRRGAIAPSLSVLRRMQPESGGFLEAVPLTSFVAMSLAAIGKVDHPVTQQGLQFIRDSLRSDGSWPIDTNLATWNTTLAINALAINALAINALPANTLPANTDEMLPDVNLDWLLSCQHTEQHPFTGAAPGGWGWNDLSGAVPDADDTAGALLALAQIRTFCDDADARRIESSARLAIGWLLDLQNRDGGWPTFCRGWGKFPFDRSGADLTAHALRALRCWQPHVEQSVSRRIERAWQRGWRYLQQQQRADGSWVPLWFGHQDHPHEENPVFGTARVLTALQELGLGETSQAQRGFRWLASVQQPDGGWSGCARRPAAGGAQFASSVEETALAVDALLGQRQALSNEVSAGVNWLIDAVLADRHLENAPIGFYFAKLWYHERLYPLVFAVAALGHAVHR